jgi:hypothetical protein
METTFLGSTKLTNVGIVLEMNTPCSSRWVQTHKTTFLHKVSGMAIINDHMLSVIIEHILYLSHSHQT